jgi:hypothetical protein
MLHMEAELSRQYLRKFTVASVGVGDRTEGFLGQLAGLAELPGHRDHDFC